MTEQMQRAANTIASAADDIKRSINQFTENVDRLEKLLGSGYGNTVERLIQALENSNNAAQLYTDTVFGKQVNVYDEIVESDNFGFFNNELKEIARQRRSVNINAFHLGPEHENSVGEFIVGVVYDDPILDNDIVLPYSEVQGIFNQIVDDMVAKGLVQLCTTKL